MIGALHRHFRRVLPAFQHEQCMLPLFGGYSRRRRCVPPRDERKKASDTLTGDPSGKPADIPADKAADKPSGGSARESKRGRLFLDRDYHVHLGGAIPPWLVQQWERAGELSLADLIPDVASAMASSTSQDHEPSTISIKDALVKYRGANVDVDAMAAFYARPPYPDLPTFLTLYRAYSRRPLVRKHAAKIANGGCLLHPMADVRVSVPDPLFSESYQGYARRALNEMAHFCSSLRPAHRLVVSFPRQTFSDRRNKDYFQAFVEALRHSDAPHLWKDESPPAFDFVGQPLPVQLMLPLLDILRHAFPKTNNHCYNHTRPPPQNPRTAQIFYHHGEICNIPLHERVRDTLSLLDYVDRIGHAICLGVSLLQHNDTSNNHSDLAIKYHPNTSPFRGDRIPNTQELKQMTRYILHRMSIQQIGIEVCPTCNLSLGGATDISYVNEFLNHGVDVYVGTDDPGFVNTSLSKEIEILNQVIKA